MYICAIENHSPMNMEEQSRRYPIGIQNFEQLRAGGYVYVDKTALIYKLTHAGQVYFLSRPRRFGKSLLVSTLEAYFQGKKELFSGLAIETLEKEWKAYPVLHIDFSISKYLSAGHLHDVFDWHLRSWEAQYGCQPLGVSYSMRLSSVIRAACEKTGLPVVVLVDEYDSPLLDSNDGSALRDELRGLMRDFFSPLKGMGQYLRFLFLTGISKFSQLSIFSELNNLKNISMLDEYSALCGITETELLTLLRPDVQRLAKACGESCEEAFAHLKRQYDGYHFSKHCEDIYNPFSLFNAFDDKEYRNYWFSTGTPTSLVELLGRTDFDVRELEGLEATEAQFDAPTECLANPVPILYQSGYLTIKSHDPLFNIYKLGYPNDEVRYGFTESLLPQYAHRFPQENTFYVVSFIRDLQKGDIEGCLKRTRAFFASIPHTLDNKSEKHYQTIFYLLFKLMGQYVDAEVCTAIGRADVVIRLADAVYVFEFKLDGSAEEALAQIDDKHYAIPYAFDRRRVVKIGVNFDSRTWTLGDWAIRMQEDM